MDAGASGVGGGWGYVVVTPNKFSNCDTLPQFLYFFNPLAYGLRGLAHNEFLSSKYELYPGGNSTTLPSTSVILPPSHTGSPYYTSAVCSANPGLHCDPKSLGESILTFLSISSKTAWKWGGIG